MLSALRVYARANQAVLVTPFIMAGAMAPASTAGAIAQLNAEVLAGIAYRAAGCGRARRWSMAASSPPSPCNRARR